MFKNHAKTAWRNLKSQPFFTFLNTTGLAIGMAGGLLIALFIYDELSFDKMFADSDRIYRVNIDMRTGGETNYYATVSVPLAVAIKQDCPHVEMVTRFRGMRSTLLRKSDDDENVKENFSYRIEIGWWVLALSALLAIAISIITVSYQSIKAAMASPVKSLRSE